MKKNSITPNTENSSFSDELDIPALTSEDLKWAVKKADLDKAKRQTTIRLKTSTIYYFQALSQQTGIPYQTLINMYLDDCAAKKRVIEINWN